jgi:hypothetical protein
MPARHSCPEVIERGEALRDGTALGVDEAHTRLALDAADARRADGGSAIGWAQGFGILFDDLVAAFCTLLVIALWRAL